MVNADNLSTEGFGPLCWVLRNSDLAQHGMARTGAVWHGPAQHGMARTADGSTEGSPSLLFSWEQVWSGPASRGPLG